MKQETKNLLILEVCHHFNFGKQHLVKVKFKFWELMVTLVE